MHNFLDWNTLEFKKQRGREKVTCPNCQSIKHRKNDKSISINHNDGYGKCHRCESLTFKEDKEAHKEKDYKLPVQTWRNYTSLSDNMVKYLEGRKISQATAIALNWTEEKYYQPALGRNVNNLVFNYFEGETLVNKKYRDSQKNFTQSAGTKSIFYNINSVINAKRVYILEGEFDLAAIYELNKKDGIISLPNGANDNDEFWKQSEKYLKDVELFIIGTDADEKGQEVKEKIAQRLGRYRCSYLEFVGKDANEDLISGDLANTLKNEKRFPVSGTFTASDLRAGVNDLYDNGLPDTIFPKSDYFGNLKDIFSVMRGQVVLPTGIPSHGKSTFTDWYVLNLIKDYGMKASWYTPEHTPMDLYETELIQKTIGRNFWKDKDGQKRISKEDIDKYDEWANEKIYLTDCSENDTPTWSWLLDKFKEQMFSFGVDIFVIDAFNKVILPKGNKIDEINNVLTKLTHFARSNNVIIFLVAHPTKMKKNEAGIYDAPTLYDVSGSSDFRNQVHCGYTIYRHFGEHTHTDFINLKTKYSFQGEIGGVESFDFCSTNGRLVSNTCHNPYTSLIDGVKQEQVSEIIPTANPQEAFEDNYNLEDEVLF